MKISKEEVDLINSTPGLNMHASKVRINLLLDPELALKIIEMAGHERISHWLARHVEDIVLGDEKQDRIEMKLDMILSRLK